MNRNHMSALLRLTPKRAFATLSNAHVNQPFAVFDRQVKRRQRDRAAIKNDGEASRTVDYLRNEVAERMVERLLVGDLEIRRVKLSQ